MFTNKNTMGVKALFTVLVLVVLTLTPSAGRAEEDLRIPHLSGHQFTTNTLTGDPFVNTYIRNTLGMGQSIDLFVPLIEIGNPPEKVGLTGDLLKAILEFEYQQAVKDWVAFRVQVRVTGRLGTGAQSLLASGVTANTGFEFGWLFKLAEGEKTALSGTLNVWNNSVTVVDFLGFVDGIVNPPIPPLVKNVPTTRGGGGLRYAWAASDLVGFIFKGETGMGESIDRSKNSDEWFFNFAAATDFDLKTKTPVPLGLALGYKFDTFPEGGEDLADAKHDLVFRISYTGTTDFLLSLDFNYGWFKLKDRDKATKFTSILLNLRYYF
ncbi:MAG: hypothetical protein KAH56_02095 [Candidatus Krumholzibacteria bacterium]|nr:hypothetical protein [Candidatus Krumholzibacteria bacterium]